MTGKWLLISVSPLLLISAGCAKRVGAIPPTPPPARHIIVLLPDPDGRPGGITVTNPAGAESLTEPYQAVRLARADIAPSPPFRMDPGEVKRLFGATEAVLPAREIPFTLYFDEGTDELTVDSEAQLPAIFQAIQERRSTAISVTGHTDTTGDPDANYQLGMKRAQRVAGILVARGLAASDVFVASHGETDLVVKTARGVAEQRNRRVEVIVR
jgi:peptidoglycan-associated lipoprotein